MKNKITIFLFCAFVSFAKAQNSSVEKSITGIQTGFLGVWVFNEFKITDRAVPRTEVGWDSGFGDNGEIDVLAPGLALEPRLYYNLAKRIKKGKNTKNNSANFFALTARYSPDWFVISNNTNKNVPDQILRIRGS